jgi:membrane-associated HD superfamily phosphohydrolase
MNLKSRTSKNYLIEGKRVSRIMNLKVLAIAVFSLLLLSSQKTFAHCDSYDGPVIKEAVKALETNNVNLVLKWIAEEDEKEISDLFKKTYALKNGDKEIYTIVEKHFFETLVRLHRATEGVGYTGLKPAGSATAIVKMADKSIDSQSVDDLAKKFTAHIEKVVREKFDKVQKLSLAKNESLEKGRAYVAAYVDYTHTLEGIHAIIENGGGHSGHNH